MRLDALALITLLACGSGVLAASANAAAPPALLRSSHLPLAGTARASHSGRLTERRRHHAAVRAPDLRRHGTTLTWSPLRGISTYLLLERIVRGKRHDHVTVSVVKGTHVHPKPLAGRIVGYSLRARVKGAKWSHRILIRYAAVKARRPSTSGSSGPLVAPPPPPPAPVSSDPIAGQTLYVDPQSDSVAAENQLASSGDSHDAALIGEIASQPTAKWFGDWSSPGAVGSWVSTAAAAGEEPVIVAYDLPWLDCGGYSAGGASSPAAYETFINEMVAGLAGRRAVVIVEPDALAEVSCLSPSEQASYYQLLNYAVTNLTSDPLAAVYLDAGNSTWQSAATMASRLAQAGVAQARGFSLNVSNFNATSSEVAYGTSIDGLLGGKSHFVVDTSRNGQGPGSGWCNPPGRGLGVRPTATTGNPLVDAFLWIKDPGESDGTCNGGPSAGTFWTAYAEGLASNAVF